MRLERVRRCLVDMDGVLCDFVSAACRVHGREWPYSDPRALWGMSPGDFYAPTKDRSFWANLAPYPDAAETLAILSEWVGAENVALLTSPANAESAAGKMDWVERHFPSLVGRLLIGRCKQFCACPESLLIDDDPDNCRKFVEWGGQALVVPRPWNSESPEMVSVADGLRELLRGQ